VATIDIVDVSKRFILPGHRPRGLKEWLVSRVRGNQSAPDSGVLWALKDVSFSIERGETFGVIGDNGSGKSTLLKLITGIAKPTRGHVGVAGRVSPLIELGAGFHPDFSGRENIFLNGAILGIKRREMAHLFESIVAFSELERFIDSPVKTYSSGMYMRLAFSIAIHVDPDILVIDEVLAVGDAPFQQKCLDQIQRLKHAGKTIVLVSHSLPTVREICQRAAWLDKGELRAVGKADAVLAFYQEQVSAAIEAQHREAPKLVPDGRATLIGLGASDARGLSPGPLVAGAPARFTFQVTSRLPASGLDVIARIARADGVCCYDVRLPLSHATDGELAGDYALVLDALALYAGSYSLGLSLAIANTEEWLDEKFFNFSVEGGGPGYGVTTLAARLAKLQGAEDGSWPRSSR
jgi:ABC-type polysaccharide/polyol phosphate transport system ATPase subunit